MTVTNKDKNTIINVDTDSNVVHKTGDEVIGAIKTFSGELNGNIKLNTPQGHMLNGKIVTSVSGGALTVAIKTLAGNDPSISDPVYVRIGNTVRVINSALSVTGSSGTNWLNLSSNELQNQEVDLFVYLRWNSLDNNINVFFSRIPYARVNTDFISSATSEKGYVSLGSYTASDECEVVGRFNAILSNTAQWSIPATSIIVNRPIFETRWLDWNPIITGTNITETSAPNTYGNDSRYKCSYNQMSYNYAHILSITGTQVSLEFTMPFIAYSPGIARVMACATTTPGNTTGRAIWDTYNGNKISVYRYDSSNFPTGNAWTEVYGTVSIG